MSWQAYVDSQLVATGSVDQAAIFGIDGKDVWARSDGFHIKPEEMEAIQAGFKDPSKIQGEGIKLNGQKYTVLSVDESSIRAKKGKEGLVIVKTKLSLIIAHHPDNVTTPNCVNVVESLAAYLVKANY